MCWGDVLLLVAAKARKAGDSRFARLAVRGSLVVRQNPYFFVKALVFKAGPTRWRCVFSMR